MTETAIDTKALIATLKTHGWQARLADGRWFLKHLGSGEGLECYLADELAAIARIVVEQPSRTVDEVITALEAPPAPTLPPGSSPADALPLMDIMIALERQAAALPDPLPRDHPIPRPDDLPERFPAPIDIVIPGRYQPRTKFDQTTLDDLAASIQEHGILNPLVVFANENSTLELIAGERRLRAARQAGLLFVPVEVRSYTLRQIDEISTIDNLQREDLTPIEEGTAYERMIRDWEISEAELARRLGKNRAYIQQRRGIATAAPAVAAALDAGVITFSQARGICQGAPNHAAAQVEALNQLRNRSSWQGPATEEDAKKYADEAVLSSSKDALAALGWTIKRVSANSKVLTMVYADRVRPTSWTSTEILGALQEHRRPPTDGEVPPVVEISRADLDALHVRGWQLDQSQLKPWLLVTAGKVKVLRADELAPIVAQAKQDVADLQARYAKAGWTLTRRGNGRDDFDATTKQGRKEHLWSWSTASGMAKKIEAGKEALTPNTTMRACARCKQLKPTTYVSNDYYCADCLDLIRAEAQRDHAAIQTAMQAVAGAWLAAAPDQVLRLLALKIERGGSLNIPQYAHTGQRVAAIRAADTALLRSAVLELVVALAYHARHEDLGGTVVQPTAAEPNPPAVFADGPLAGLWRKLTRINGWLDHATQEPPTLVSIQGNRENLGQLADELKTLADDPDLTDEEYEALAQAIGEAELRLDQLAEVGAAPTLAEVEV